MHNVYVIVYVAAAYFGYDSITLKGLAIVQTGLLALIVWCLILIGTEGIPSKGELR